MSHGPGQFQRAILERLSAEPVQRNQLQWELAEALGKVDDQGEFAPGIRAGRLNPSFEKQFGRALRALVERHHLRVEKRHARDVDETLRVHPFQTTRLELRQLRERLLPLLPRYLGRFSAGQNEEHLRALARHEDDPVPDRWQELEIRLRRVLGRKPESDDLFMLLVRGHQLFCAPRLFSPAGQLKGHTASLGHLLKEVVDAQPPVLSASLCKALQKFYEAAFPPSKIRRARVKSQLYQLGNFGGSGDSSLNAGTLEHLWRVDSELVESLPGHVNGLGFELFGGKRGGAKPESYDSLMYKLIDRSAFRKLQFVRP